MRFGEGGLVYLNRLARVQVVPALSTGDMYRRYITEANAVSAHVCTHTYDIFEFKDGNWLNQQSE